MGYVALRLRSRQAEVAAERADAAAVLATVAAALDTAAVLLDGHEVVLANDAALALRVVRGRTLTSPVLARLVRDARRSGSRVRLDVELPWGAVTRPVQATAAAVPDTDQAVVLLEDLADRRRVEAVRRDFVANVSHELKTPLGGLLLLAESVRDAAYEPGAARPFAERMIVEVTRLSRLVQELIELSRLQGADPLPHPDRVPVARLIEQAVERVRFTAESADVELTVAADQALAVWGDERSLVTALTNLLDNAIAYSPPGRRVGVGARERDEEVEVAVSDEGVGIPSDELERIFERFYRTDPARSRTTGGSGLGLAIVKHVAENNGGRVTVWSSAGIGSTFTLHLPIPPTAPPLSPDQETVSE